MLLLFVCISLSVFGQGSKTANDEKVDEGFKFKKENVVLDGNIGVQIGTVTVIDISPVLAYRFTPKFIAGPGAVFRYYQVGSSSATFYGWKFMSRYYPLQQLFVHAEFEQLFIPDLTNQSNVVNRRRAISSLPVGVGYVQSAGPTSIYAMILYNLLDGPNSPYTNPIVRIGVTTGF